MEHTGSEWLGRGEIILKPATKITNHIDGKNVTQKDLKGVSKEKHTARKVPSNSNER